MVVNLTEMLYNISDMKNVTLELMIHEYDGSLY